MIIDKKISFGIAEKTEKMDGTTLIKLIPSAPEGVQWASPAEVFVVVQTEECALELGGTYDGLVVAQYDDGVPEE
jgi:hypothetical protein